MIPSLATLLLLPSLLAAPAPVLAAALVAPEPVSSSAQDPFRAERRAPEVLYDVVKVVDGDTIHVDRDGTVEKLRLLSVDTEERIQTSYRGTPTKPNTVFGEECAQWAMEFFDALAEGDGPPRVGLRFPEDVERRDVYGRLLCHVVLPDGTDFNVLLVEKGKSPYFNKYGNSLIAHAEFVAAQARAQEHQLGIWDPATNAPATPGAPAAKRPYDRLLPWWRARAEAVDAFRLLHGAAPDEVLESEDADGLERAAQRDGETRVFGTLYRAFDEEDGSLTLLFRATDTDRAFRALVAAEHRPLFAALDLPARGDDFRQNYLWVRGRLQRGERGFEIRAVRPEQIELAGPEPVMPAAAGTVEAGAR